MKIKVTTTGAGGGAGTREDPYESGGIYFQAVVEGGGKLIWNHRWMVGGIPIEANKDTPEMWYGRDGTAWNPSFHPTPKTTLSMVRFWVHVQGEEVETKLELDRWVMAAADEPEPMFGVDCTDGIQRVTRSQLDWLKANGYVEEKFPRPFFNGTREELRALLGSIEEPDIPTEPPNPCPDPARDLQICYAPILNFDYSVTDGMLRDPRPAIDEMKRLGAKLVHLWLTTQHLYHGTSDFERLNPCYDWYKTFIDYARGQGLQVVGKLPFWGLPSWFDSPGVPPYGGALFGKHLEAKRQMMEVVNRLRPDYVMLGNEPQLNCTIRPNPPIGPDSITWEPAEIVKITNAALEAMAPELSDEIRPIGPALAGTIETVKPSAWTPEEFLAGIAKTLARNKIRWCGINAYQFNGQTPASAVNYGAFYSRLRTKYPLWPSEIGISRRSQPGDAGLRRHLEALIEHSAGFSPNVFSYFLYRDFNQDGWGLRRADGTLDARAGVLAEHFGGTIEDTAYVKALPVRVRWETHRIDAGIQLLQRGRAPIEITLDFVRSRGAWMGSHFEGTGNPGQVVKSLELVLGPSNPVAFNVRGDLQLDVIDAVLVKSDEPLGGLAIWTTQADHPAHYAGFPALD